MPPVVRIAWGREGLDEIAPLASAVVIVDVLRFTTAVTVAVARGATVRPVAWREGAAGDRSSLSPVALDRVEPGTSLVLPSRNGSALAFRALEYGVPSVSAGCLLNASAAGRAAAAAGGTIAVVACGELDAAGRLRMAVEDLTGAGAVIAGAVAAGAAPSDAAQGALETFETAGGDLPGWLRACESGQELVGWGFGDDVDFAARHDVSDTVPVLLGETFVA